ncbi:unnamed protein product [Caenorhabditis brenneri]
MEYGVTYIGEKPVLTELPDLVLRKVIKELDVQSVRSFRGTCGRLLTLTPSPYDQLTGIHIRAGPKGICVFFRIDDKTQKLMIVPISKNTWENMLLIDWNLIFGERKTPLKFFSIEYIVCVGNPDVSSLYKNFQQILKSRPPISTESVHFDVSSQDDVLRILPFCDPKHLKVINLVARAGEGLKRPFCIEKLYELEQWKRAEELEVRSVRACPELDEHLGSTPFAHFSHIYIWSGREMWTRGVKRRKSCYTPGSKIEYQNFEEHPRSWLYWWLESLIVAFAFVMVPLLFYADGFNYHSFLK